MEKILFLLAILFSSQSFAKTITLDCVAKESVIVDGKKQDRRDQVIIDDNWNPPLIKFSWNQHNIFERTKRYETEDDAFTYIRTYENKAGGVKQRITINRSTLEMKYNYIDMYQKGWTRMTYQCEVVDRI